jgi:hypothetical protein
VMHRQALSGYRPLFANNVSVPCHDRHRDSLAAPQEPLLCTTQNRKCAMRLKHN